MLASLDQITHLNPCFLPSITWCLNSPPGLDGGYPFFTHLAMRLHAKLYIILRSAQALAVRMGKAVSDVGPFYRS
jgi:hypothetical protein